MTAYKMTLITRWSFPPMNFWLPKTLGTKYWDNKSMFKKKIIELIQKTLVLWFSNQFELAQPLPDKAIKLKRGGDKVRNSKSFSNNL